MIVACVLWGVAAGIFAAALWIAGRVYLARRMAEAFELGIKMGRGLATMPQFQVDAWLAEAGIDASMLPGFEQ